MGVDRSLSDEQVAQGVMRGSRGLLPEALRGQLGHVRAKRLFSAAKGISSALGPLSRLETQPTRNVQLYCGQEVLDNLVLKGLSKLIGTSSDVDHMSHLASFTRIVGGWGDLPWSSIGHLR